MILNSVKVSFLDLNLEKKKLYIRENNKKIVLLKK